MSGGYQPQPGQRPPLPSTGSGVMPPERSRVTNVLVHKTTADRIEALPPAPSGYVAPDDDPA